VLRPHPGWHSVWKRKHIPPPCNLEPGDRGGAAANKHIMFIHTHTHTQTQTQTQTHTHTHTALYLRRNLCTRTQRQGQLAVVWRAPECEGNSTLNRIRVALGCDVVTLSAQHSRPVFCLENSAQSRGASPAQAQLILQLSNASLADFPFPLGGIWTPVPRERLIY
jgi:hypothetical protein